VDTLVSLDKGTQKELHKHKDKEEGKGKGYGLEWRCIGKNIETMIQL
jgi:hypothetical protein